jgi:hypothetical protein
MESRNDGSRAAGEICWITASRWTDAISYVCSLNAFATTTKTVCILDSGRKHRDAEFAQWLLVTLFLVTASADSIIATIELPDPDQLFAYP